MATKNLSGSESFGNGDEFRRNRQRNRVEMAKFVIDRILDPMMTLAKIEEKYADSEFCGSIIEDIQRIFLLGAYTELKRYCCTGSGADSEPFISYYLFQDAEEEWKDLNESAD